MKSNDQSPALLQVWTLSLELAKRIMEAAERKAVTNEWKVTIAVMDAAGELKTFQRMDGTTNATVAVAIGKAKHAINYGRDTRFHYELLAKGNYAVGALPGSLALTGGVQLIWKDQLVGSIGVSGAAADDDEKVAQAGAEVLKAVL